MLCLLKGFNKFLMLLSFNSVHCFRNVELAVVVCLFVCFIYIVGTEAECLPKMHTALGLIISIGIMSYIMKHVHIIEQILVLR